MRVSAAWRKTNWVILVTLLVSQLTVNIGIASLAKAQQIEPPDRKYLFIEDKEKVEAQKAERRKKEQSAKVLPTKKEATGQFPFDIDSPNVHYDSATSTVVADGGLIISHGGTTFEADKGQFKVDSREGHLEGNVWISDRTGTIAASDATVNMDTVTGKLSDAEIFFAQGGYQVDAGEVEKLSGDVYKFDDVSLTTCDCPKGDDCSPWRLSASEAEITREGYGHIWGATLRAYDVPVFYFPYLIFPAKTKRQSGFLPATFGRGRQSGLDLQLPFFWAVSNSSDATITGILESNTRYGMQLEARKRFDLSHSLELGGVYLDEKWRKGELQGTDTAGLFDPTIDENRYAGYFDEQWRTEVAEMPLQLIVDGAYVSDDLFLREFENDKIAPYNARYVTSTAVARTSFFGGLYSSDLSAEYNQAVVTNDDLVFKRVPEFTVDGIHRFRPFGENPLGAKIVLSNGLDITNFRRVSGFDGTRYEIEERAKLPFHVRNYFDGEFSIGTRGTLYQLADRDIPNTATADGAPETLEKSTDRVIPDFTTRFSNVVEKVFDLADGNPIKTIAELGSYGRARELVRVKHTIEPELQYKYVPYVGQEQNPQFDSDDRLAERSVITYGVTQRLFGRYSDRNQYLYGIEEATPEVEDLGSLRQRGPLSDEYGLGLFGQDVGGYSILRKGAIRELAALSLSQSYDTIEGRKNQNPDGSAFSDIASTLTLYPNEYIRVRTDSDFDAEKSNFSSYGISTQLIDKRGDQIRARLSYTEDRVRQLESGIELRLTDRLKLAYYTRYDDLAGEFIENRFGVRLKSDCKCWVVDGTASEKTNPDETRFLLTVTLVGIGEISNTLFTGQQKTENQS